MEQVGNQLVLIGQVSPNTMWGINGKAFFLRVVLLPKDVYG
jgi:hypothetical protein